MVSCSALVAFNKSRLLVEWNEQQSVGGLGLNTENGTLITSAEQGYRISLKCVCVCVSQLFIHGVMLLNYTFGVSAQHAG